MMETYQEWSVKWHAAVGTHNTERDIRAKAKAWQEYQWSGGAPIEGLSSDEWDASIIKMLYKLALCRFEDSDNPEVLLKTLLAEIERAYNESR